MAKKLALFLIASAVAATAGSVPKAPVYRFTLHDPAAVNGNVLQPGEYKVVVKDTKASLTDSAGKTVEASVKVETAASKFDSTAVTIQVLNSKPVLAEIDFGGSKTKLFFVP